MQTHAADIVDFKHLNSQEASNCRSIAETGRSISKHDDSKQILDDPGSEHVNSKRLEPLSSNDHQF